MLLLKDDNFQILAFVGYFNANCIVEVIYFSDWNVVVIILGGLYLKSFGEFIAFWVEIDFGDEGKGFQFE